MSGTPSSPLPVGRIIVIGVVTLIVAAFLWILVAWFAGREATLAPRQEVPGRPEPVAPSSAPADVN